MKIHEISYGKIVATLAAQAVTQLEKIDESADDLNEIGGVDSFAEIHLGGGLYLTMQLTSTLNRRDAEASN